MTEPEHAAAAAPHRRPVRPPARDIARSVIGAFAGIGLVAAADQFLIGDLDLALVIGAFGASAVLVYGAPFSPLAHPYNVLVGHLVSATIGVAAFQAVGGVDWLAAALAVSLAIGAMQITRSVHPPGGASALIAVVASSKIHALGFLYVLYPVGIGAVILVAVAWVSNNAASARRWPAYWFTPPR